MLFYMTKRNFPQKSLHQIQMNNKKVNRQQPNKKKSLNKSV